jgi:hypothetical protein
MTIIDFNISTANPSSPPVYDPRLGTGISFYVNSSTNTAWLGLATTGIETWGRFQTNLGVSTTAEDSEVGDFTLAAPLVTTSNSPPSTAPSHVPSEGKLHIHIAYLPGSDYRMYVGVDKDTSQWSVYYIVEVI